MVLFSRWPHAQQRTLSLGNSRCRATVCVCVCLKILRTRRMQREKTEQAERECSRCWAVQPRALLSMRQCRKNQTESDMPTPLLCPPLPAHKVGVQQIGARKKAAGAVCPPTPLAYKEIYLLISCARSTTPDITINASPHTRTHTHTYRHMHVCG